MSALRFLRSIRGRLTLSYVAAMVIVLAVYAAGIYVFVSRNVSDALDARVRADFMWATEMYDLRSDGSLSWFDTTGDDEEDYPWLQVWSLSRTLIFQSSVAQRVSLKESAALASKASGTIQRVDADGLAYRVLTRQTVLNGQPVIIQVARSEAPLQRELNELLLILLLGLPAAVLASALGGYAMARNALAPVDRMVERARSITAERLHDRLPVDNPEDELGRLATVFNRTLERLEQSFQQMRKFTADVSHELRTPLTAIRTVGEVALREQRDARAYRSTIGSMLEDVERLTGLVERLLALSRADAGLAKLRLERFDLGELAEEIAGNLGVLAEEREQTIVVRRQGPVPCLADQLMIRQAVMNLVDNAIKYGAPGTEVGIEVDASPTHATLEVIDAGPGIDPERGAHIFDRFYRGDTAGGRDDGRSHGLGLSIAHAAVKANHGTIAWTPRPGGGTIFRIVLPVDRDAHRAAADDVAGSEGTRVHPSLVPERNVTIH
ncbi:MAG: sensor histidine kinase [Vicinamibacterales bacterium]